MKDNASSFQILVSHALDISLSLLVRRSVIQLAALSVVPFIISVVMVLAGLSLGITHGVDLVAGLVESPVAYLLDEGWLRSLLVGLIAWPIGLIASVVLGYQVGFLISNLDFQANSEIHQEIDI